MSNRPVREPFFSPIKQFVNTNAEGLDDVINTLVNDINAAVSGIGATIAQGGSLYVDQFGTFHDFVHDDGVPIQVALNVAAAAGGGQVILGPHAYWASSAITVPPNVQLCFTSPPEKQVSSPFDYTSVPGSIYLTPSNTLTVSGALVNVRIFQDNIHFAGNPTTSHGLQTIITNFSTTGTGVVTGAQDATIRSCTICGFNLGLQLGNFQRPIVVDVLIDSINAIQVGSIGDVGKGAMIEAWPFYSANRGFDFFTVAISGVADNGSGVPRVTTSTAHNLVTGDEIFNSNILGFLGANGKHSGITVIDATHFDLTGILSAPTATGTTTNLNAYVSGISSLTGLWEGMGVTGTGVPGSTVISKIWRGANAITLSNAATASGTVTLTFANTAFSGTQTPQVLYYTNTRHGIGIEYLSGAQGTMLANVFVHDHDVAIKFDAGAGANLIDGLILDAALLKWDVTRIGVQFAGNAFANTIVVNYISSIGTAVSSQSSAGAGFDNKIIGGYFPGVIGSVVEANTGALTLIGISDPNEPTSPGINYTSDILQNAAAILHIGGGSSLPSGRYFRDSASLANFMLDGASSFGGAASTPVISNPNENVVNLNLISNSSSNQPIMYWKYNPGTTDNKIFRMLTQNGTALQIQGLNDSLGTAIGFITMNRVGVASGNIQLLQPTSPMSYTVATLPTGTKGQFAYVTDAAAVPVWNAIAAGGGTIGLMVQFNGTNWVNA